MKKALAKLWPKEKFPKLRGKLSAIYRSILAIKLKIEFQVWKINSLYKYGVIRKIKIYGDYEIYINSKDFRGFVVAKSRGTQIEKINIWREMAKLKPEMCIDVGANYGEFSIVTAKAGINSLAIEINPIPVECLRQTFQNFKNVNVRAIAASNFDGEKSFFFNPNATGSGSFSKRVPDQEIEHYNVGGDTIELIVSCKKLDTIMSELNKTPDSFIIKIDVEGHEDAVLNGMTNLFKSARWWRGLMEFSPQAIKQSGKSPQAVWDQVKNFEGYIIEENKFKILNSMGKLPDMAPTSDCDIIIGNGRVSN